MDYPKIILSNQKEEYISIQRVEHLLLKWIGPRFVAYPLLFSGGLIYNSAACQKCGRKCHLLSTAMSNFHNTLSLTLCKQHEP